MNIIMLVLLVPLCMLLQNDCVLFLVKLYYVKFT